MQTPAEKNSSACNALNKTQQMFSYVYKCDTLILFNITRRLSKEMLVFHRFVGLVEGASGTGVRALLYIIMEGR